MQVSSAKSTVALTFIPVKFKDMLYIHVATGIRVVGILLRNTQNDCR